MHRDWRTALAAAALTAAITGAARADQTLNGAVGLPLNATAQIPLPGQVRVQASYFDLGDTGRNDLRFYGIHGAMRLGATPLEVSAGVERLDVGGPSPGGDADETGVALGAKFLLTPETNPTLRIAAGGGYSRALLENVHAYMVATKYFPAILGFMPAIGHMGVRYDRFSRAGFGGGDSERVSVYGGMELPLPLLHRTDELALVGEVQSKNSTLPGARFPYSVSVRYRPTGTNFSAKVGVQRQGLTRDSRFFAQAGLSF